MVDILVRNVDEATAAELKKKAKAQGRSVNDLAREALKAAAKPSREEAWAEIERIRRMSPYSKVDSTDLIREDRDNDEPYR